MGMLGAPSLSMLSVETLLHEERKNGVSKTLGEF